MLHPLPRRRNHPRRLLTPPESSHKMKEMYSREVSREITFLQKGSFPSSSLFQKFLASSRASRKVIESHHRAGVIRARRESAPKAFEKSGLFGGRRTFLQKDFLSPKRRASAFLSSRGMIPEGFGGGEGLFGISFFGPLHFVGEHMVILRGDAALSAKAKRLI